MLRRIIMVDCVGKFRTRRLFNDLKNTTCVRHPAFTA
jgi:hypothetical protein